MTFDQRQQIRRVLDMRARKQQAWWDEFEAFVGPSDPAIEQIDAAFDAQVFDTTARELMLSANLGLAIAAHNLQEAA
jgi:hypothetical protein